MFSADDSIVAVATPHGRGGIGVVRVSGTEAPAIAAAVLERREPLEPRRATFTRLRDTAAGAKRGAHDEVVVTFFPAPHSYTGEHVVEISAHGSPVVLRAIVDAAVERGARLARPGEFTLRAFLNGKRNLVQAEAVADLIAAATPLQARVAFDQLEGTLTRRIADVDAALFDLIARLEASLDFPDEGYHFVEPEETARRIGEVIASVDELLGDATRGRMIREGATVVIAGRPNVGKSSIFNALAGTDRAIVTDVPGTTRDLVTEVVDVDGLAVTLVDTAGWHDTADVVEREGVARAGRARESAHLVLLVLDASEPLSEADERLLAATAHQPRAIALNKCDRPVAPACNPDRVSRQTGAIPHSIPVSAKTGEGLDGLRCAIARGLTGGEPLRDTAAVSNSRHIGLLQAARASLTSAQQAAAKAAAPEEFVLTDLQAARMRFDEVVGTRTSADVLQHIFERFCIGK
jgi:tRNA modification GTPase